MVAAALVALPAAPAPAGQAAPRTVDLRVSHEGFRPARLRLRRGEPVEIVLRTSEAEHCFAIDGLRVEKRVVAGKATRFVLTPAQAGDFPFYCCLESGPAAERERGQLTVSD